MIKAYCASAKGNPKGDDYQECGAKADYQIIHGLWKGQYICQAHATSTDYPKTFLEKLTPEEK